MLPSVEAFLALWDDPVEFVELEVCSQGGYFLANVVIQAPDNPKLVINMHPIKTGEA